MSTIAIKIDVTKIDKSKLFKGAKGTYLDIVLIETPDNQYGDSHMAVQSVSKEEREQGIRGAILGNAKTFGPPSAPAAPPAPSASPSNAAIADDDPDSIPF